MRTDQLTDWLSQIVVVPKKSGNVRICIDPGSGRCRWLCLPFGLFASSEIFQKKLLEALAGPLGVICIADDIIVHGQNEDEHDRNLDKFLQRCVEKG